VKREEFLAPAGNQTHCQDTCTKHLISASYLSLIHVWTVENWVLLRVKAEELVSCNCACDASVKGTRYRVMENSYDGSLNLIYIANA
jgi:hypothetical protein